MTRPELEQFVLVLGITPEEDDRDEDLLGLLRDRDLPAAAGTVC